MMGGPEEARTPGPNICNAGRGWLECRGVSGNQTRRQEETLIRTCRKEEGIRFLIPEEAPPNHKGTPDHPDALRIGDGSRIQVLSKRQLNEYDENVKLLPSYSTEHQIESTVRTNGLGGARKVGQLVTASILKYRNYSLLFADGSPKRTVDFAKLVDRGSSRSMPKSKYDVHEATPHLLTQYETGRRPGPASEGKIDGMLLENPQFLCRRLSPRTEAAKNCRTSPLH